MSATMDVDHFSQYFGDAPVLYIEGRQYPVKVSSCAISAPNSLLISSDKTACTECDVARLIVLGWLSNVLCCEIVGYTLHCTLYTVHYTSSHINTQIIWRVEILAVDSNLVKGRRFSQIVISSVQ